MPNLSARARHLTPIATALAVFAFSLPGCHRGSSPSGSGLFGPASAAEAPLHAKDAYPSEAATTSFAVMTEDGDASGEITVSIEPDSESQRWRLVYQRSGDESPFREDVLSMTDDGAVMIETTDFERDALTVYDPPLTLMPSVLAPGEPFEQTVDMVVHPANDRESVKRRGSGTQTLELVGAQSVRTSSGRVDAMHVRSRFEAELAPARVVNDTERWYASDQSSVGFVAERYDETLFIFGVESSSQGHLWIWRSDE